MSTVLPNPGDVFESRYRLERVLGEGGFARVYLASDLELGRPVALKVLLPKEGRSHEVAIARFLREAELVGGLNHPNIVTMFDRGRTSDGLVFGVFELVPGQDLSELMANGPMRGSDVERILRQLLDALRDAHDAGVVHRDLKPANIRVFEYQGDALRVKLLDFGIARPIEGHQALTATGHVVGTPGFIAPEQIFGEAIGPHTDIYSLGLVAYEMLTGGPSNHMRLVVQKQPVLLPAGVSARPQLRHVIERMLEREIENRYASARAALADLASHRHATVAQPAKPAEPASDGSQRRPSWHALAGVGVVFAGALGLLWSMNGEVAPPHEQTARRSNPLERLSPSRPSERAIVDAGIQVDATVAIPDQDSAEVSEAFRELLASVGLKRPTEPAKLSAGCGLASPSGRQVIGLRNERVLAYVPQSYDSRHAHALILVLHDGSMTPAETLDELQLEQLADREGFILIAPGGLGVPVAGLRIGGTWRHDRRLAMPDLVRATLAELCIDPARVYALGLGRGGKAGVQLSSESDTFAATVAGWSRLEGPDGIVGKARTPHLRLMPLRDLYDPVEGGFPSTQCRGEDPGRWTRNRFSATQDEETHVEHHHCSSAPAIARFRDGTCFAWSCEAPFVSCQIDGGRHWSGSEHDEECGGEPAEFPYGEVAWEFMDSFRRKPR